MKRTLLFLVTLTLLITSCNKKSSSSDCVSTGGVPTAAEITSVQNYLTTNSITATQDARGFFYKIIEPGTGANPTLSSTVTVTYKGTLTNGNVFDQTANGSTASFPLSALIKGWQLGIPLIKKGGRIMLYLPPSLGYGCTAQGSIPAGSNLVFDIQLVNF